MNGCGGGDGGGDGGGGCGLDLTLQRGTQAFLLPCRKMMMMVRNNNNNNHHHQIHLRSGGGGGGGGGPTGGGGAEEVVRCMSDDVYDVAGGSGVRTLLQPFDNFSSSTVTSSHPHTLFKSPGGMAASLSGFPFTTAQWKELERQAMIYKYMMASVPVPPDLLIPITRNFSHPSSSSSSSSLGKGSIFNLRFSNGADPEPGRCRRTDGKKWRCSRDVAPNQKYCERHMHRGRPRSRKPVEVHADVNSNSKKIRHYHALPVTPGTVSNPAISNNGCSQSQYLGSGLEPYNHSPVFLCKSDAVKASPFQSVVSVSSFKETRSLEWMAKGGAASMATADQQWQQLMQTKIGLTIESSVCNANAPVCNQQYQEEPINLNPYTDSSNIFLNPGVVSVQKPQTETPRGFIDAWSSAVSENTASTCNKTSVSSNGKLSPSSLTLSMGGDNGIGDEMGQTEMGLRSVMDSDQSNVGGGGDGDKPQLSTWLTPASWAVSAPGGPLAEVLRPSPVPAAAATPPSPGGGNGDYSSPPETAASSPSGVLQKPLVSPSDSSGNSSPLITTSPTKPEIAFPWLNQSKVAPSE